MYEQEEPAVKEPEIMDNETQDAIVEAVRRLSERFPDRGGAFDWASEVAPEWNKVLSERSAKGQ
jgi:hypothetical protein